MKYIEEFPNKVKQILHCEIQMKDGCRLAARIWMPENAESKPVPAILEYLPYRKSDMTSERDSSMQPYLAGHGYAVIRLDIRGSGDSEGVMKDEYLEQELQDGYDAIEWISQQSWCDGQVGMIGISWGGFNGLQIAAMQPPALKSIITICSTDDRYEDDVHYMGGCVLGEQLSWASIMFGRNTLPPDPNNVGDRWKSMWLERLQGSGLWLKNWLLHQRRDAFWKHGSVCEDYSNIKIPVYAVSGWADGYCRSVLRLMEKLNGPKKGLIGPWAHRYPHLGKPGPSIGFLQEELRWWDYWMKNKNTGIMDEAPLRLYMQDHVRPQGCYQHRPGRWITEPCWPSPNVTPTFYSITSVKTLQHTEGKPSADGTENTTIEHQTLPSVGMASGKWCGYATPGDAPIDQNRDDVLSLQFETDILLSDIEIAGDMQVQLRLQVDQPVAQVAVRVVDVAPNGEATRVSFGVKNLNQKDSREFPQPLIPGEIYDVMVPMKSVAQRFRAGHKIRLAVSTSYFPMVWPSPKAVTITLHTQGSGLYLPIRESHCDDSTISEFEQAQAAYSDNVERLIAPEEDWSIREDAANDCISMNIAEGKGQVYYKDMDLTLFNQGFERYQIDKQDLSTAHGQTEWEFKLSRGDWSIRTLTHTSLQSNETDYMIKASMQAWYNDELFYEQDWDECIPREFT